jgi:hypothetical protein
VAQAQTQLDGEYVQDTDVTVMRSQYEHAIATLIGKPPAEFNITPAPQTALQLPLIPVGLPTSLLESRPDIAAAERRVAEANDQIGICSCRILPITLAWCIGRIHGNYDHELVRLAQPDVGRWITDVADHL